MGCSKKNSLGAPTYPVRGQVLVDGVATPGVTIMFVPKDGQNIQTASGRSDEQGRYVLGTAASNDGAMEGDYIITVQKTQTEASGMTRDQTASFMQNSYRPDSDETAPKSKDLLPVKYKSSKTSDLTYSVQKGKNEYDIKVSTK
jgi:hypothetical protein